uniref:Uncharacterized protein n=1 Tax=Arion vulgaris TaxID=1028688 RepID=A0A0B7BCQ1_9EUPU
MCMCTDDFNEVDEEDLMNTESLLIAVHILFIQLMSYSFIQLMSYHFMLLGNSI